MRKEIKLLDKSPYIRERIFERRAVILRLFLAAAFLGIALGVIEIFLDIIST